MNPGPSNFRGVLILGLLWILAFSLACRLAPRMERPAGGESVADRVLGVSRVAFGQSFYVSADDYFHRGVGHKHALIFTNRLFQRWGAAIRPSGHLHAEGHSVGEILPWLRLATAADPGNVEAFLTMAYWLARLGRYDAAEQVLREAQRLHPRDVRLLGERGRLAFRQKQDQRAAALFDAALRVWPNPLPADDGEARLEKARLLSFRAVAHELRGELEPAKLLFREALQCMPQNEGIRRHIERIESGAPGETLSREALDHWFPVEHHGDREDEDHGH